MHDIFYFTDVHGQLDLFQTMRDWCYKQDPECMIVYGGDACDRGDFGFDIMEMIVDDPQIVYLRGNHEDMFLKSAHEIWNTYPEVMNHTHTIEEADNIIQEASWMHCTRLHICNGGYKTLKGWLIDGASTEFLDRLEKKMAYTFSLDNGVCFSHAGGLYETWQRVNDAEYNGDKIDPSDAEEMIWDRDYLYAWWPANKINVYGHTPTVYLDAAHYGRDKSEANIHPCAYKPYAKDDTELGWKLAMDTGMTWTGRGYVLNCLTITVYGFYDADVNKLDSKRPLQVEFETYKII